MTLPIPVIDHIVVNAREALDSVADIYARLGFTLTPRGHHTLGSSNNLAIFGTDYLELVGVLPGRGERTEVLDWPAGLNGLVFRSYGANATHDALCAAGVPVLPVQAFSRPVEMPDGVQDASFRTVRLTRDAAPPGRVYFCEHLTPGLVWHEGWQRHANGVLGVARIVIAAADPPAMGMLFARMFGDDAVRRSGQAVTLLAGLARVDVVTPAAMRAEFGDAAPDGGGRQDFMAAMTLRTASADRAAAALAVGGIPHARGPGRVTVPGHALGSLALVFQEWPVPGVPAAWEVQPGAASMASAGA